MKGLGRLGRLVLSGSFFILQNNGYLGCQDFCTAICCKLITSNKTETKLKKVRYSMMKGYYTDNGYMGYINGSYRLFADESDYRECLED